MLKVAGEWISKREKQEAKNENQRNKNENEHPDSSEPFGLSLIDASHAAQSPGTIPGAQADSRCAQRCPRPRELRVEDYWKTARPEASAGFFDPGIGRRAGRSVEVASKLAVLHVPGASQRAKILRY
jgi:hypothetical protein